MASDRDNPFADPGDGDRTVVRPTPGRRPAPAAPAAERTVRPAAPAPAPTPPRRGDEETIALPAGGLNPVVAAAAMLLALATSLRRAGGQQDIAGLRTRIVEELKVFERRIRMLPLPLAALRGAHYAVCATLDDIVLNTPWGSRSLWTSQSLVSTFHNEVTGGERFFEILRALEAEPAAHIDALELFYACLALGFEGKYRVDRRGAAELAGVRDRLYQAIRQVRGEPERELSPRWHGVPAPHRSLAERLPLWVAALVACVVLLGAYMAFSFSLSDASDPVFAQLARLGPRGPVAVANAAPALPRPAAVPSQFLAREVAAGLAAVQETDQTITATLRSNGMFASGSATVDPRYVELLQRVADEINAKQPGRVMVLGYTDTVPIRTLRFPSNYALSLARAEAAAAIIKARLSDPGRVGAEGRGDADPVQPNTTVAGRDANRRIDIVIMKAPGATG